MRGQLHALDNAIKHTKRLVELAESYNVRGSTLYLKNLFRADGAISMCQALVNELPDYLNSDYRQTGSVLESTLSALKNRLEAVRVEGLQ